MTVLVDTLLFLDVVRCRVHWARVGLAIYAVGVWAVIGFMLGRAV